MNSLVRDLETIKENLSKKCTWEIDWNNKVTHYFNGSLINELSTYYSLNADNYKAAFACVAKAILISYRSKLKDLVPPLHPLINYPNYPDAEDVRVVAAFHGNYNDIIKILELAIRFAKVYSFS